MRRRHPSNGALARVGNGSRYFSTILHRISDKDGSWEDADSVAFSEKEEKVPYPKSVFFILSTETCERFSYYGMRSKTT